MRFRERNDHEKRLAYYETDACCVLLNLSQEESRSLERYSCGRMILIVGSFGGLF